MKWSFGTSLFFSFFIPYCAGVFHTSALAHYKKIVHTPELDPKKIVKSPLVSNPELDALLAKNVRDMTLAELRAVIPYARTLKKIDLLIKYVEKIVTLTTDQQELHDFRFEIADLHFQQGNMKKARKLFKDFVQFYPGTMLCDEAERKEILSRFYARNMPPRDMTKTRKTIILANRYLDHPTHGNRAYIEEIAQVRNTCYQELFDYDIHVVQHYLRSNSYTAARTRLENSKQELLAHVPAFEPRYIELEGIIAQESGDKATLETVLESLKQKFPMYTPEKLLTRLDNNRKRSYVTLF